MTSCATTDLNAHDSLRLHEVGYLSCIVDASTLVSQSRTIPRSSGYDDIVDDRLLIHDDGVNRDVELSCLTESLHYGKDVGMQLLSNIRFSLSAKEVLHTPASMNGLDTHSFHQNCLSTRRHRGREGYGSAIGEYLPSIVLRGTSELASAPRPASRSCCFCDFNTSSCLCCNERVRSRTHVSQVEVIRPYLTYLTEIIREIHVAFRKLSDRLADDLGLQF